MIYKAQFNIGDGEWEVWNTRTNQRICHGDMDRARANELVDKYNASAKARAKTA